MSDQLEEELACCREPPRTRAMACDIQRRIVEDDDGPPRFLWASQNITAAAALLRGLPEHGTPEEHQIQRNIHALLDRVAE